MPNRIIRDAILDSDRYHGLTHNDERLLFVELLLLADDFGLVPLNPAFLRRRTTPCTSKTAGQLAGMVSALADADLVRTYQSEGGGVFGYIPRFNGHPRAHKPKWPLPPSGEGFNEIRDLAKKRSTDAKQVQTNAPEYVFEYEVKDKDSAALRPSGSGLVETPPASQLEPDIKANGKVPPCPYAEIAAAYHEVLPELPAIVTLSAGRKTALQARWREVVTADHLTGPEGVKFFRDYFAKIKRSGFLMGKVKPKTPGGRSFRADWDWIFNGQNFLKILEDRYQ